MILCKNFIILVWLGSHFLSGIPAYPGIPAENRLPEKDYVFKIERSRDSDVVYYQIKLNQIHKLHPDEPLEIFWIKHTDQNQREPLTRMQRRWSYGIKYLSKSPEKVIFQFRATDARDFIIQQTGNNLQYKVYTRVDGKVMQFEKMYIHFGNDSFLNPAIEKIDLHVSDPDTGIKKVDSFIP